MQDGVATATVWEMTDRRSNSVTVRRQVRPSRSRTGSLVLAAAIVLSLVGLTVYLMRPSQADAPIPAALGRGSPDAAVVFEEWGDFQ